MTVHPAFLATTMIGVGLVKSASAHDVWDNGEAVPPWVKRQCCGVEDAHHLQGTQVHVTPQGYRLDGYSQVVSEKQLLPSPDGSWWVFYRDYPDGTQSSVFCFFGPSQGS